MAHNMRPQTMIFQTTARLLVYRQDDVSRSWD